MSLLFYAGVSPGCLLLNFVNIARTFCCNIRWHLLFFQKANIFNCGTACIKINPKFLSDKIQIIYPGFFAILKYQLGMSYTLEINVSVQSLCNFCNVCCNCSFLFHVLCFFVPGTRPVGLVIIKGYFQTPAQLTMFGVFDTTESTAQ